VRRALTLGALLAALAAGACQRTSPILGAWEAGEGMATTTYFFRSDGTGARIADHTVQEFRYRVEYERDPVLLDLDFPAASGPAVRVRGIVKFQGDRTLRLRVAEPGAARPEALDSLDPGTPFRRPPSR
jgi:hypothetical protein